MNELVFLDASFWIVYRDEDEAPHRAACVAVAELFRQRVRLVATLPVLCEIYAYFARDLRKHERILKDLWQNPIMSIEEITQQDQEAAIGLLRAHSDKSYSLCDALSFMVMRRLKITRVATFDDHFRQFGEFEITPQFHD